MSRRAILAILALVLAAAPTWARDWHVDPNGTSTACTGSDGTSGNPHGTIQKSVDCSAASDVVLVHAGTYSGYQTVNGSACNPGDTTGCISATSVGKVIHLVGLEGKHSLTIRAASGETPILDGNAGGAVLNAAFSVSDSNNVIIDGFDIRDFSVWDEHGVASGSDENLGAIILDAGCNGGQVLNNTITGSDPNAGANAVAADINLVTVASDLVIRGNAITTALRVAISFHRTSAPAIAVNGEISGNYILQSDDAGNPRNGTFLRALFIDKTSGVRILNNLIASTDASKVNGSTSMYIRDEVNVTIQGNVIRGYSTGIVVQDSNASDAGAGNAPDYENHVISNNTIDSVSTTTTEAGIDMRQGAAQGCNNCALRNNVIMNNNRGFLVGQTGDPNAPTDPTLIGANLTFNVPTWLFSDPNGLWTDELDNEKGVALKPVLGDPNSPTLPTAAQWFARSIGEETDTGTHYHLDPNSTAVDLGNAVSCPSGWPTNGSTCDAGAYELNGAAPEATGKRILITSAWSVPRCFEVQ